MGEALTSTYRNSICYLVEEGTDGYSAGAGGLAGGIMKTLFLNLMSAVMAVTVMVGVSAVSQEWGDPMSPRTLNRGGGLYAKASMPPKNGPAGKDVSAGDRKVARDGKGLGGSIRIEDLSGRLIERDRTKSKAPSGVGRR